MSDNIGAKYKVDTRVFPDGRIEMDSGVDYLRAQLFHREVMQTKEAATKDALKRLGWIEPDAGRELLEALEGMVATFEQLAGDCQDKAQAEAEESAVSKAVAAIAKAKGEWP